MAESMTKHEVIRFSYLVDLANCTGMGMTTEYTRLCKYMYTYTLQYIWMTLSHSIVAPPVPVGYEEQVDRQCEVYQTLPSSCEGAGSQTTSLFLY